MKLKKSYLYVLGILVFILILYLDYRGEVNSIKKSKGVAIGKVYDKKFQKGSVDFYFEFYLDGERYTNSTMYAGLCLELVRAIEGKYFPVVYEGGKPDNSELLINKESFEKFDMALPDSLQWVNQLCK